MRGRAVYQVLRELCGARGERFRQRRIAKGVQAVREHRLHDALAAGCDAGAALSSLASDVKTRVAATALRDAALALERSATESAQGPPVATEPSVALAHVEEEMARVLVAIGEATGS